MNKDKIAEMKGQDLLRAEMANAFKVGDSEKVDKIKKRMEPVVEKGEKHPWA